MPCVDKSERQIRQMTKWKPFTIRDEQTGIGTRKFKISGS